jgi:hypothetical protein
MNTSLASLNLKNKRYWARANFSNGSKDRGANGRFVCSARDATNGYTVIVIYPMQRRFHFGEG